MKTQTRFVSADRFRHTVILIGVATAALVTSGCGSGSPMSVTDGADSEAIASYKAAIEKDAGQMQPPTTRR